jgi:hypothetical protein
VINDARVSRQHASITRLGTRFVIEDMTSANGTFINGERIRNARALYPGDMIRVGNSQLLFRIAEAADTTDTPEEAPAAPSRLILRAGSDEIDRALDAETELRYRLILGPMVLTGCCGKVVLSDGGCFLEQTKGPVEVNGAASSGRVRLEVGDDVTVAGIRFTVAA